ncbi:MAG: TetR/AcrR family transcriptional regulator [Sphingobacteriales bacterium]|nr:TetR/AcrR family transcriptional regulator [Sphingobacteriales bacterium]
MNYNDKQLQIMETAEMLFANKGFDGTSVRDIAEVANINVAMISYYFGSKEKLMEAIFELKIGRVQVRVESLIKDNTLTPLQKVETLIDEHIDRMTQSENFYKIMLCEQITNKNPEIIQKVTQLKIRNAELVAELIKDGQAKGEFKKDIDIVLMLNSMIGTVWQTIMMKQYYREFNNLQSLTDEAYKQLIKDKLSTHIKTLFKAILTHEA